MSSRTLRNWQPAPGVVSRANDKTITRSIGGRSYQVPSPLLGFIGFRLVGLVVVLELLEGAESPVGRRILF
jgi:hypothetical protein